MGFMIEEKNREERGARCRIAERVCMHQISLQ